MPMSKISSPRVCLLLYSCNLKGLQLPISYEQTPMLARIYLDAASQPHVRENASGSKSGPASMRVRPPIRARTTCFDIPATSGFAAPHRGIHVGFSGFQSPGRPRAATSSKTSSRPSSTAWRHEISRPLSSHSLEIDAPTNQSQQHN